MNDILIPLTLVAGSLTALAVALIRRRRTHESLPRGIRFAIAACAASGLSWWGYAAGLPALVVLVFWLFAVLALFGVMSPPPEL